MSEARDLIFCVLIEGWGPNPNCAKVSHRAYEPGSRDLHLIPGTIIRGTAEAIDSSACSVCVMHSMQPLPNYFGLLFYVTYLLRPHRIHERRPIAIDDSVAWCFCL